MRSSTAVKGKGICRGVVLSLPQLTIKENFLPLDLRALDVVLGMQWLQLMGKMEANWPTLTSNFCQGGRELPLRGKVSLKRLTRKWKPQDQGFLVKLRTLIATNSRDQERTVATIQPKVQELLLEYSDLFRDPTKLPPRRMVDHIIPLKEGQSLVNVRPYRYPHVQKAEIERLISDMLTAGVIIPSVSPFSSLIILVKKKNGSWRFCVDYRTLINVTIPDKFPIPLVEELLDELHGSTIYSKIDLKSGYHQIRMAMIFINRYFEPMKGIMNLWLCCLG